MNALIRLATPALAIATLACQTTEPGTAGTGSAGAGPVVAEIYGESITAGELDDWIRDELFERETRGGNPSRTYEVRAQAIERLLTQRILEHETRERNLTTEDFLSQEVEAMGGVTAEEVAVFYAENRAQMGGAPLEDVAARIENFLRAQRSRDVVASLRESAGARVLLEPVRLDVAPDGPARGPADARITIVEFSDFQCPFCRRAGPIIDEVLERYGDDVRFVYRHLPLANHSRARPAAEAAVCADGQGQFWAYHDKLFENSRQLGDADLVRYAEELGLDVARFQECLAAPATRAKVEADLSAARDAGISGTPAFVVNGVLISGAKPASEFIKVIDEQLERLEKAGSS